MENLNTYRNGVSITQTNAHFDKFEVHFDNHEKRLIELIEEHKNGLIFGCVAWLTSKPILKALAKHPFVQIIVQKEDFLRPDLKSTNLFKRELEELYSKIKFSTERHSLKEPISDLSICDDGSVYGIMCVGNYNEDKVAAFPRAHHKFLVFCKVDHTNFKLDYEAVGVWTGSYNFTNNATYSFENSIYMEDMSGKNKILNAYLEEHHSIFKLAEELDWEHNWICPRYRIGT